MRRSVVLVSLPLAFAARPAAAQLKASGEPAPRTTELRLTELRRKNLLFPGAGTTLDPIQNNFDESRGSHVHHAMDIPAPRGTPVLSADSGRVLKLYRSKSGGIMVYASDVAERYIYVYAHLDRYYEGLTEGQPLARGDTLGYVGTTGNAPKNLPHLHFQIMRMPADKRTYVTGAPVNPFPLLRTTAQPQAATK